MDRWGAMREASVSGLWPSPPVPPDGDEHETWPKEIIFCVTFISVASWDFHALAIKENREKRKKWITDVGQTLNSNSYWKNWITVRALAWLCFFFFGVGGRFEFDFIIIHSTMLDLAAVEFNVRLFCFSFLSLTIWFVCWTESEMHWLDASRRGNRQQSEGAEGSEGHKLSLYHDSNGATFFSASRSFICSNNYAICCGLLLRIALHSSISTSISISTSTSISITIYIFISVYRCLLQHDNFQLLLIIVVGACLPSSSFHGFCFGFQMFITRSDIHNFFYFFFFVNNIIVYWSAMTFVYDKLIGRNC